MTVRKCCAEVADSSVFQPVNQQGAPAECVESVRSPSTGCTENATEHTFIGLLIGCSLMYFLLWVYYVYHGKHILNKRAYNDYKVGNMVIRLQVRSHLLLGICSPDHGMRSTRQGPGYPTKNLVL